MLVAAVVSVLVEGLAPRATRRAIQLVLVLATLVAALVLTIAMPASEKGVVAAGSLSVDGPTLFMWVTILVIGLLATLLMAEKKVDPAGDAFAPRAASLVGSTEEQELTRRGWEQTEIWPLFLFALTGMLLFPAANDLLMLFVALEVMSLPLYLLAGMARRRRLLSQEAALKYFLLGAFASAFLLYGSAMLFGYAGALDFASISDAFTTRPGAQGLQLIGIAMVSAGLLFKVAAVPVPHVDPRRLPGLAHAGHRVHGGGGEGRGLRGAPAGHVRGPRRRRRGTGSRSCGSWRCSRCSSA